MCVARRKVERKRTGEALCPRVCLSRVRATQTRRSQVAEIFWMPSTEKLLDGRRFARALICKKSLRKTSVPWRSRRKHGEKKNPRRWPCEQDLLNRVQKVGTLWLSRRHPTLSCGVIFSTNLRSLFSTHWFETLCIDHAPGRGTWSTVFVNSVPSMDWSGCVVIKDLVASTKKQEAHRGGGIVFVG